MLKKLIDSILRIVGVNQPPLPVIIEPKPPVKRKPTVAKATTRKPAPRGRPKKVVEVKNVKRKAKPKA